MQQLLFFFLETVSRTAIGWLVNQLLNWYKDKKRR